MNIENKKQWTTTEDNQLIDSFGRHITYVRISVTDRCDFRCVYCMSEDMTFLPKKDVLSLEELERLCSAFIKHGVKKLRITGGEPLVRRGIMTLFNSMTPHLQSGALHELTLTTNGSQLHRYADDLVKAGVKRINISLDTLHEDTFRKITRWGRLPQVLDGIKAAQDAGLKIKINTVAQKGVNDHEVPDLIAWAHSQGMALTLIETMPLGSTTGDITDVYLPLTEMRAQLEKRWTLVDSNDRTNGPARYVDIKETGGRLGFITPLTHNFCDTCNRVRVTSTGTLYMCLGQENCIDLRSPLRASEKDDLIHDAITRAIMDKPQKHDFKIDPEKRIPAVSRNMSVTGG